MITQPLERCITVGAVTSDHQPEQDVPQHGATVLRRNQRWWRRQTIRDLKREAEDRTLYDEWDARDNKQARLPDSETVHLGGLVLTEAFTPSTISNLYDSLRELASDPRKADELLRMLDQSRQSQGSSGRWRSLGMIRGPGQFTGMSGRHDPTLPENVSVVWLHLDLTLPSTAMLVATFTFTDDAADLSEILRTDFVTRLGPTRVTVVGPLGRIRSKMPWARPRLFHTSTDIMQASGLKAEACEQRMVDRETECGEWLFARFPGLFATASADSRPVIRILLTDELAPFTEPRVGPMGIIDLDDQSRPFRCPDEPGWWLIDGSRQRRQNQFRMTLAARRKDAARTPGGGEAGDTNWWLVQRVGRDQPTLAARLALRALLAVYAGQVADLRDRNRGRRHFRHPVRDARAFDGYLLGDGLDASSVTSDIAVLSTDLTLFRWSMPEYTQHVAESESNDSEEERNDLAPALLALLSSAAERLASDTEDTTRNLRASAELQQAIANTRLQRSVLILAILAIVIAVIGLLLMGG